MLSPESCGFRNAISRIHRAIYNCAQEFTQIVYICQPDCVLFVLVLLDTNKEIREYE